MGHRHAPPGPLRRNIASENGAVFLRAEPATVEPGADDSDGKFCHQSHNSMWVENPVSWPRSPPKKNSPSACPRVQQRPKLAPPDTMNRLSPWRYCDSCIAGYAADRKIDLQLSRDDQGRAPSPDCSDWGRSPKEILESIAAPSCLVDKENVENVPHGVSTEDSRDESHRWRSESHRAADAARQNCAVPQQHDKLRMLATSLADPDRSECQGTTSPNHRE